jgi:carbon storage regulator
LAAVHNGTKARSVEIAGLSADVRNNCDQAAAPRSAAGQFVAAAQERNVVMLVLSRKKNESIVINNDITIVVVEIRGDKVRLGIEAPKEVPVHRREVYDAIKRNAAVQNGPATTEAGSSAPVQS